jgi:hypothetical protein
VTCTEDEKIVQNLKASLKERPARYELPRCIGGVPLLEGKAAVLPPAFMQRLELRDELPVEERGDIPYRNAAADPRVKSHLLPRGRRLCLENRVDVFGIAWAE